MGRYAWQEGRTPCPLRQVDLAARSEGDFAAVDNSAHQLWHAGRVLPCDREIEALALWRGHVLTLSADTDCVSIADGEGWLVTAKAGIYPQDMALSADSAWVCGGADGMVHVLSLPGLHTLRTLPVPGMPERIALAGDAVWLLCLSTGDDALRTDLVRLSAATGESRTVAQFSGLPGALLADRGGLWCAVGEQLLHYPLNADAPDVALNGFGLIRRMSAEGDGVWVSDPVAGITALIEGDVIRVIQRDA